MDVQLPDGRIIKNVPEGTTKAQLMQKLGMGVQEASPQPAQPKQRTLGQEALRQLGLTGRYLAEGAANVAGIATNPLSELMRQAGMNVQNVPEAVTGLLDRAGVPNPQGSLENVVGAASRGVASSMLPIGAGLQAAKLSGLTGRVGAEVAKAPITQIGASIGSAGAGEATKQAGGGEVAQLVANLAGGLAGGSIAGRGAVAMGLEKPSTATEYMSSRDFKERARSGYIAAGQSGAALDKKVVSDSINKAASAELQSPKIQSVFGKSPFTKFLSRSNKLLDGDLTIKEFDDLDKQLTNVLSNQALTPIEKAPFAELKSILRDKVLNPNQSMIKGGQQGFSDWRNAVSDWRLGSQVGEVEKILDRQGMYQQDSTAIQTGFRTLYNNKNKLNQFTGGDKKLQALVKSAAGLSKIADPARTIGSRIFPLLGLATGGPVAGAATYAAGAAGRSIADNAQARRAQAIIDYLTSQQVKTLGQDNGQALARALGTFTGSNQ